MSRFPARFLWGTATSAYQIEGGVDLDGRGPSIWDTFCATPGRVRDGADGSVAADHRHRWREDVALLARLGVGAYRFSVAWPRVQPDGAGAVSESGLDFYRGLVDELLAHGIEPVVTLYHWDLPQALEDHGGWPARETAVRFGDFAALVGRALGDRVTHWSTVNEPWCTAMLGYGAGVHAPGRHDPADAVAAAHHLLLGHGLAVDALRANGRADAEIALSLNPYPVHPAGDGEDDLDAVRRVDGVANRWWYDAVLLGRYPADVLEDFSAVSDLRCVRSGDLEQISRPVDALGLNYYRRYHVRHSPDASRQPPDSWWPGSPDVELVTPEGPVAANGWAIEPDGLTEVLTDFRARYGDLPVYVHENGVAFADEPASDGAIHDDDRVAFLHAHVDACARALEAGVHLRGYFVWSLLDNFEWSEGYRYRFGLVRVEPDGNRTLKDSARWYADLVRNQ